MPRYKTVEQIQKIMSDLEHVRNIGIIAHVDHGKTTTSDTLLAAAGIISAKVAGEALALDYLDVEQKRGVTVKSAKLSFISGGKTFIFSRFASFTYSTILSVLSLSLVSRVAINSGVKLALR